MKRNISVIILAILALASHVGMAGTLMPADLRCEYASQPLGVAAPAPRLSWTLTARNNKDRGLVQSAYRVLVASSAAKLGADSGDLWDSGKVNSSQSIYVPYAGKPLSSAEECFWKVEIWDQAGKPSAWSGTAKWTMGLLQPQDWRGRWIGWDAEPPDQASNPLGGAQWIWSAEASNIEHVPVGQRFFRRSFTVPANRTIKRAVCWMAADSKFECFLNGARLGAGSYNPPLEFDVTENLRSGFNVLGVLAENTGNSPKPGGLLALLRVEFTDGAPLIMATDHQWRVSDEAPASWATTEFADTDWKPVKAFGLNGINPWKDIIPENGLQLPARMLRREFTMAAKPKRALLFASGLGLSEFYLNGTKVDDRVLSPSLSDYSKRVFYVTLDVTEQLRRGVNCLGAVLGNGRFYSPRLASSVTYGLPKLCLQLRLENADGSVTEVVSDEQWRLTTAGPIRANNEYDGEIYDARLEQKNWSKAGFDDTQWQPAQLVAAPKGVLSPEISAPIRITGHRKPVGMTEPRPSVFVFDLGQNMVGWCRLKMRGPRGAEVTLRHAESLQTNGTLYVANLRGAKATDVYTLHGNGWEVWEPHFTYHGFRYVELRGYPGKPSLDTLEGCIVNDDLDPGGTFACANPLVNQIYSNVLWGVRGNYRSLATDCPQRDERQGWLGDRSAESKGETYLFVNGSLYAKWVQDMVDAQRPNGSMSDVCPAYWPRYSDNVSWPSSLVLIPGVLYDQFGDMDVLSRTYPAMKLWVNHLSGYLTNDLMFRDEYGDWCVPPEQPQIIFSQDPARKTAPGILGTAYFYHCLTLMHHYATLLGDNVDAQEWESLGQRVKTAFNREFYRLDVGYYDNGSQTSCILPLMFGMVPDEYHPRVFARLVDKITHECNYHVGTGLIGGQWLMRTLSDNGRADLAYALASQKTYPSWGYMVEKGATTLWELWNGDTADPSMNSQNHVMLAGDLVIWLNEYLAGIQSDPSDPAFHHILMQPHPVAGLAWVRAAHRSPYGWIRSEWRQHGSEFEWVVTVPPNTTATLHFPGGNATSLLESGKPARQQPSILSVRKQAESVLVNLSSGTYRFALATGD